MSIARWILALVLGGFLILFGALKLLGQAHIFQYIEASAAAAELPLSGQGIFYPILHYLTGIAEIVAGVMVIIPATRALGAFFGVGVIGGAIVFHMSPYLGINTPAGFAEGAEAPWTLADFPPASEHSPVLFIVACVMIAVAVLNLALSRR